MGGPHMVRARRRNGEAQPLAGFPPRVVHGQLLPLDVEGELFRPLADPGRRDLHAVGQKIPQPRPAEGDPLDPLQHRLGVPELEVDPLGIGLGEDALPRSTPWQSRSRHRWKSCPGCSGCTARSLWQQPPGRRCIKASPASLGFHIPARRSIWMLHRDRRGSPPPVCSARHRHSTPPRSSGSSRPSVRR